ncbi:MAG TPA: RNase adapter RapZ [Rhodospirillales bacterium]|nr:RNase adapter RapZ [Rhodospirillales bacterium]
MTPTDNAVDAVRVLLVTGMSGAGKTSALKALEDLGYEAMDNVPLSLINNLTQAVPGENRPIALGVDIRTRDFGLMAFEKVLDRLSHQAGTDIRMLFIDCDDEELKRRYAETRHRHPLALDRPVADGIALERRIIAPLRDRADQAIDTTGFGPGELKHIIEGHFGKRGDHGLSVFVTSFSYRRGLPREADLVFDVRFLANPHYDPDLKSLSGLDPAVGDFIVKDPGFEEFFDNLTGLLSPLLPRYVAEGKSYLTIAVGCTGGRHRSVFVTEKLATWLKSQDHDVSMRHRDLKD